MGSQLPLTGPLHSLWVSTNTLIPTTFFIMPFLWTPQPQMHDKQQIPSALRGEPWDADHGENLEEGTCIEKGISKGEWYNLGGNEILALWTAEMKDILWFQNAELLGSSQWLHKCYLWLPTDACSQGRVQKEAWNQYLSSSNADASFFRHPKCLHLIPITNLCQTVYATDICVSANLQLTLLF